MNFYIQVFYSTCKFCIRHSIFDLNFTHEGFDLEVGNRYTKTTQAHKHNQRGLCNMANCTCSSYQQAFGVIQQTITDLENMADTQETDGIIMRLDYLNRSLVNVDNNSQTDGIVRLIEEVVELLSMESNYSDDENRMEGAAKEFTGNRGRPSFDIKEHQLSFLVENGFKVPSIAQLFKVSSRTIERRMTKYGLSISGIIRFNICRIITITLIAPY